MQRIKKNIEIDPETKLRIRKLTNEELLWAKLGYKFFYSILEHSKKIRDKDTLIETFQGVIKCVAHSTSRMPAKYQAIDDIIFYDNTHQCACVVICKGNIFSLTQLQLYMDSKVLDIMSNIYREALFNAY